MRWDCLLLASVRGRVGDTQLIHESLAEVPLPHLSVRIPTPQRVCVDDAYIDEPPCEGRPVLHALPLHSIVLPELINCVHMALVKVVVNGDLGLSDSGGKVGATVLLEGDHMIDSMMSAEEEDGLLVIPQQAAQVPLLPCLRLTLLKCFHGRLQAGR
jgi:hypothetical protein